MIIRDHQMTTFADAASRGFEDRMLDRLRSHFPKHEKCLGADQLRVLIRLALENSKGHAITSERNVALYLDLMCVLGSGFDRDPQFPWAAEILADLSFPTQDERLDRLHARGWEFAQKVSVDFRNPLQSRDGSRLIAGFGEIRRKTREEITPETAHGTADEIFIRLKDLFPVKTGAVGDACLRQLVKSAMTKAAVYGIRSVRGAWLFAALMFVVGAGFDSDPQLPWASRILTGKKEAGPAAVTDQLYSEAKNALKEWWGADTGAQA